MKHPFRKKESAPTPEEMRLAEKRVLIQEIHQVRERLDMVQSLFDLTSDYDMIEYYIHEANALEARYRFLLRLVRQQEESEELLSESLSTERVCEKLG